MAESAVTALKTAIDAGFKDLDKIGADDDLKAIRDRDYFRKLLASLDVKSRIKKAEEMASAPAASPRLRLGASRQALVLRKQLAEADPKNRRFRRRRRQLARDQRDSAWPEPTRRGRDLTRASPHPPRAALEGRPQERPVSGRPGFDDPGAERTEMEFGPTSRSGPRLG